jgi:glyoxylase-like metal-dependent hydrolase (beta-lactamase superfamily II)
MSRQELPVAHPWFRADDAGDGITRLTEPFVTPFLVSNVWHVRGSDRDLVVDTGNGVGPLRPVVDALTEGRPVTAAVTHGHFDHVGCLHEFDDRLCHDSDVADVRSPFPLKLLREDFTSGTEEIWTEYGHEAPDLLVTAVPDPRFDLRAWACSGAEPTGFVRDGDVVDLGDRSFEVMHVPGHTAGSICLWESSTGVLFTGDTVYMDDRLGFDDQRAAVTTLRRIRSLPVRLVCGGHGRAFGGEEFRAVIDRTLVELEQAPGAVERH